MWVEARSSGGAGRAPEAACDRVCPRGSEQDPIRKHVGAGGKRDPDVQFPFRNIYKTYLTGSRLLDYFAVPRLFPMGFYGLSAAFTASFVYSRRGCCSFASKTASHVPSGISLLEPQIGVP